MDQMLRDPIWQFIGVIISLVALVVAIAAIRFQQQRKALGYYYSIDRPVFYLFNKALRDRLVVTLDGKPVTGLSTREVCFFNYGNTPIIPSDYVEQLTVAFPDGVRVLGVAVTDTVPQDLSVGVQNTNGKFGVAPTLLNPGDEFVLQFLVEQPHDELGAYPLITGRVSGVKKLEPRTSRPVRRFRLEYYTYRTMRAAPYFILGILVSAGASALYTWLSSLNK